MEALIGPVCKHRSANYLALQPLINRISQLQGVRWVFVASVVPSLVFR